MIYTAKEHIKEDEPDVTQQLPCEGTQISIYNAPIRASIEIQIPLRLEEIRGFEFQN